jgi:hypothetical protein
MKLLPIGLAVMFLLGFWFFLSNTMPDAFDKQAAKNILEASESEKVRAKLQDDCLNGGGEIIPTGTRSFVYVFCKGSDGRLTKLYRI